MVETTVGGHPAAPRNGGGVCVYEAGLIKPSKITRKGADSSNQPASPLGIDVWEEQGAISISLAAKSSLPIVGFPGVCGIHRDFGVKSAYRSGSQSPLSEMQPERANI